MQMLSEDIGSPLKFSLEQKVLNDLAKVCWGDSVLKTSIDIEDYSIPAILITHRKKVVNNLPQILESVDKKYVTNIPKPIMNKLIDAILRVEQGYLEAFYWEERCRSTLPFTILNPVTAGEYQAGCFIDPSGHFDDLTWVKRFIADGNQFMHCKFEFACLYCFEDTIREMWNFMKTKRQLPCKGQCHFIDNVYAATVGIWAYELENEFDNLPAQDRHFGNYTRSDDISVHGLVRAIFEGHEYAVQYFWSRCRKSEGFSILNNTNNFGDILSSVSRLNYTRVVHFLYSNLSQEEKLQAFVLNDEISEDTEDVWSCLLLSPFFESALTDIFNFPHPISAAIYELLFHRLVPNVKESGTPTHKKVLGELWKHLSQKQRNEVLKIHKHLSGELFIDQFENIS